MVRTRLLKYAGCLGPLHLEGDEGDEENEVPLVLVLMPEKKEDENEWRMRRRGVHSSGAPR